MQTLEKLGKGPFTQSTIFQIKYRKKDSIFHFIHHSCWFLYRENSCRQSDYNATKSDGVCSFLKTFGSKNRTLCERAFSFCINHWIQPNSHSSYYIINTQVSNYDGSISHNDKMTIHRILPCKAVIISSPLILKLTQRPWTSLFKGTVFSQLKKQTIHEFIWRNHIISTVSMTRAPD